MYSWAIDTFECLGTYSRNCLKCIWAPDGVFFAGASTGNPSTLFVVNAANGADVVQVC
jgi:hypothetical protein